MNGTPTYACAIEGDSMQIEKPDGTMQSVPLTAMTEPEFVQLILSRAYIGGYRAGMKEAREIVFGKNDGGAA